MTTSSRNGYRIRVLLDCLVFSFFIAISAWITLTFARGPHGSTAIWISNGIWAGWLLSRRTALWCGFLIAGYLALTAVGVLTGTNLLLSLCLGAFNFSEVLLIVWVIRRAIPDVSRPRHWLELGRVATGSTLLACAASGLLASAVTHRVDAGAFLVHFLTWWTSHVVGMVIVGTLTLVVQSKGFTLLEVPGKRWDFAACMMLIAVVSGAVFFQTSYPVLFLIYPPLLYGVFQHRFPGLVVGIGLIGIIGSIATVQDIGPLALLQGTSIVERMVLLQLFVGATCILSYPVALGMAERARLSARVRESELRYRMLADYSHDVVVRINLDGKRLYVSPSAKEILGWEPRELLDLGEGFVHLEDRPAQQKMVSRVATSGSPTTSVYRVLHKEGRYLWMEVAARAIPGEDGVSTDIILAGRDITTRIAAEQALSESRVELEAQARMDPLTGLANRRHFDERLALAFTRTRRHNSAVALLYMDIDHFKQVNDQFGHAAGDEVLRDFGKRLEACVRRGDLVARLGGDEFVVLIDELMDPSIAEMIARKLIEAMGESILIDQSTIRVTTSIGIAYSTEPVMPKLLTDGADAALYRAKQRGRNTFELLVLSG